LCLDSARLGLLPALGPCYSIGASPVPIIMSSLGVL
jgi:hypothetical protein